MSSAEVYVLGGTALLLVAGLGGLIWYANRSGANSQAAASAAQVEATDAAAQAAVVASAKAVAEAPATEAELIASLKEGKA